MRKSSVRLMIRGDELRRVGALSKSASIACCALLSVQMDANNLGVTSHTATAQEGPNSGTVRHGLDSGKQDSMRLLMRLATEQALGEDEFLGKTRFSINQRDRTFAYDLSPVPLNLLLSDTDPFARPLEALIRIEALRRDFRTAIPNEKFWIAPLDSAEQVVQRCVQDPETPLSKQDATANQRECYESIDERFEQLESLIVSYADAHGLERVQPPQARDPVIGYRVYVKVDPPRARVRIMPLIEYKKYQYFQTAKEQYQWSDLLDPETHMIGWYHYRVEWPPELNGPEEGDFEIKKPGTITFRPTQK